jgi:hypothetical protein
VNPDRFGCELEFIVNDGKDQEVYKKLKSLYGDRVLMDITKSTIPSDPKFKKTHFKADNSLESKMGRELTSPICNIEELKQYFSDFRKIINEFGITNELTGLHIHMSCSNTQVDEIDLCKFVLLSDIHELLGNWGKRNRYCLNIMDIMGYLEFEDVKYSKEAKGRVWNMLKRDTHHIEIRTFGGENYQNKIEQVEQELAQYCQIFNHSTDDTYTSQAYLSKLEEHGENLALLCDDEIDDYLLHFPEIEPFINP